MRKKNDFFFLNFFVKISFYFSKIFEFLIRERIRDCKAEDELFQTKIKKIYVFGASQKAS